VLEARTVGAAAVGSHGRARIRFDAIEHSKDGGDLEYFANLLAGGLNINYDAMATIQQAILDAFSTLDNGIF